MRFEHTEVFNFEGALRGMRNPLNSWTKSDSQFGIYCEHEDDIPQEVYEVANAWAEYELKDQVWETNATEDDYNKEFDDISDKRYSWLWEQGVHSIGADHHYTLDLIGPNDMNLCRRLINGGSEHRKFLRQIFVSVDITAPLYWWKEADTYQVGVTKNSTSTMHKLASTPITLECFEIDDLATDLKWSPEYMTGNSIDEDVSFNRHITSVLHHLEGLRLKYLETKDKRYWKELVRWLPNGWLQTRTVTMNYENLRNMYHQREHHKLTEWHSFCDWVKELPYAKELIIE